MMRVLILDDTNFKTIASAIQKIKQFSNIKILNEPNEQDISYNDIKSLLNKYHELGGFDLVILDINFGVENSLDAMLSWVDDYPDNTDFSVLLVTEYPEEYAKKATSGFSADLGDPYLGFITKDSEQVFITNIEKHIRKMPPVKIRKYSIFNQPLIIKLQNNGGEREWKFKDIIATSCVDSKVKIFTLDGVFEGTLKIGGKQIDNRNFFELYCFDPAKMTHAGQDTYTYRYVYSQNFGNKDEMKNEWAIRKDDFKTNVKKQAILRIEERFNSKFPAFICVEENFAINPLYIIGSPNHKKDLGQFQKSNCDLFGINTDRIEGSILIKKIKINHTLHSETIIPICGFKGESQGDVAAYNYKRFNNTFWDRYLAFEMLENERWGEVLSYLKRLYSI